MSQSIDEVLLGIPSHHEGEGEKEGEGDEFVRQLFESLLLGTRASNAIPAADGQEDYSYNATFPEFRVKAEGAGKQVLKLIQIFLNHVQLEGEMGLPDVGEAGDPEVFQGIADVVEQLLEDVDSYLDDASGKGANQQVALMRDQLRTVGSAAKGGQARYASMVASVADIPKPQEAFAEEIDNDRDRPFIPKLTEKPNAVISLDLVPVTVSDIHEDMERLQQPREDEEGLSSYYPHPYEAEIRSFHYLPAQVQAPDVAQLTPPESLEGDNPPSATFVDTVEDLESLISDIRGSPGDWG
ncbi:unnamed protein product, partial [Discosporangium mesarthrocarpum]